MNKIKRLVITFVVAFLVVIGIGGTAHAARTDMLDLSDYNNNGGRPTHYERINKDATNFNEFEQVTTW